MRDFHLPGRSAVFASNGICATSHPLAAQVACEILRAGGNAVDAAIAGAVLLGVCEPQMTGLGGDCFALVKPAGTERILALNGSGRAPANCDAQAMRDAGYKEMPLDEPASVTLPGAVDAFCTLSNSYGKLGLSDSLSPAIRYFDEGVPIAPRVAMDWALAEQRLRGTARQVYLSNGAAPKVGTRFALPGQAEVLKKIAAKGRAGFYEGEVAEDMIKSLQASGGTHMLEDFSETECDWVTPITGDYRGIELVEHPPNGQGATALLIANILSHFDIAALDPLGAQRAHIEAEATKLAYDARDRFISDARSTTRLDHMLSERTAEKLAAMIDLEKALPQVSDKTGAIHRETVYITVVDRDLMAVSLIYSIFHSFGSGLASEKYGILFHNRGAGFSLAPHHPNELGPKKRPMHTIIPAMLRQGGRVVAPFGVMGGAYQANGHARVVSNIVDYGMDPQTALDAARCFATQGELQIERGYDAETRANLAALGHAVTIPQAPIGGAQMIWIDHKTGVLQAASDPRKDGCALGI